MKYTSLLIRIPPDIHDALTRLRTEHHVNTSAWVRATLKSALEHEGMRIGTGATQSPEPAATPLPGWRPTAWTMATEMVFSQKKRVSYDEHPQVGWWRKLLLRYLGRYMVCFSQQKELDLPRRYLRAAL